MLIKTFEKCDVYHKFIVRCWYIVTCTISSLLGADILWINVWRKKKKTLSVNVKILHFQKHMHCAIILRNLSTVPDLCYWSVKSFGYDCFMLNLDQCKPCKRLDLLLTFASLVDMRLITIKMTKIDKKSYMMIKIDKKKSYMMIKIA